MGRRALSPLEKSTDVGTDRGLSAGNRLSTSAARTGDVIFVYRKGPGAWITRLGQRIIRAGFAPGRTPAPSRYSHVALATAPGVVVHADGKKTLFQVMRDVMPKVWPGDGVRVVRLVDPELTPEQAERVVATAARFDRQPYRFGYGGRSTSLGRRLRWIWAGDGKRTLPFCSELIATAYGALGIDLGSLPPDRMLPMDLDEACGPPAWRDVTAEYYPLPMPTHFPDGTPLGFDLDFEAHENEMADALVLLANGRYDSVAGWEQLHEITDALREHNWDTTATLIATPAIAFLRGPDFALSQLRFLERAYAYIEEYPAAFSAPHASALQEMFPHRRPGEAPFEARTTLEDLAKAEQKNDVDGFVTILLRGQALLEALAASQGLAVNAPERFVSIDPEITAAVLADLPDLTSARAADLQKRIAAMTNVSGKVHAVLIARDVVDLHAMLTAGRPPRI